jgi:hypothetical protein
MGPDTRFRQTGRYSRSLNEANLEPFLTADLNEPIIDEDKVRENHRNRKMNRGFPIRCHDYSFENGEE